MISGERFTVVYRLTGDEATARQKAHDICLEQTVEFPEEFIPQGMIRDHVVGRLEMLTLVEKSYRAEISYAVETASGELTQLINVIFGNISIKPGIVVEDIRLPQAILQHFRGPRFGREGLRAWLKVPKRPLLFTALKPMGLSARELADMAYKCALGGIDIIKDDHGLTNQCFAPYEERLQRCVEAVERANAVTGHRAIYVPNVTAPYRQIVERARLAKAAGAGGLMIAPAIAGLDTMRELADDDSLALPIFSHPAFQGSYVTSPENGIGHGALFGQITRLAGADAVIYPNFGGRFSFSQDECRQITLGTKIAMGSIQPIFPSPGGGMSLEAIPEMLRVYGHDVIFLIGGGLFRHGPDLVENCRYFRRVVEQMAGE
ncbi:RuBisCO large subunit C-terminal-like domain-containing protein [Heliophilum fasciatum]|uniref:Ribulose-bisphosphate carboxylase large chain n=1 Tax=Heliophilum fasciatum TaxID=35700 RepID=A0A4R2RYP1_9FIRM|nr:RuBisCO large subunit C-terminal-like domain-containing protein [Heliophilum fasciatum]MCW2276861.1 ribulose-bisphosphate carboxylase large chain [Heliophilum fasciatum]TCP68678.1 ribulose-bisphosphate carboxylase large chain [Heliophilum fasciatum]